MPPDGLDQPIHVFQELPGQPRLPDAGRPDDTDEARPTLSPGRVEQVLELPEFLIATDERCFKGIGPADAATLRDDSDGTPGWDRACLALEQLVGRRLKDDRTPGGAPGRLTDEHGRRQGGALKAARRVDHVAGDHPLVCGAEVDRRLAGQDPGPSLDPGAEAAHRINEVQGGADRPFGVILAGDRGAPECHHRIADELLHGPAVATDDLAHGVEVASLELADLLRVSALGERRESDEVGEEDAYEAALRDGIRGRRGGRRSKRTSAHRRGALGAELGGRIVRRPAVRAGSRERRRAFHAELRARAVLGPAVRADHPVSSPLLIAATGRG